MLCTCVCVRERQRDRETHRESMTYVWNMYRVPARGLRAEWDILYDCLSYSFETESLAEPEVCFSVKLATNKVQQHCSLYHSSVLRLQG